MADGPESFNTFVDRMLRPAIQSERLRTASIIAVTLLAIVAMEAASGSASTVEPAVTISNLKVGLVCGSPQNRRVCFQTKDILITNESSCDYIGKKQACTWFGFSFEYKLPAGHRTVELDCDVRADRPGDFGNPRALVAKNAVKSAYKLELSRDRNYFFDPQYAAVPKDDNSGAIEHSKQKCSYGGRTVFEIDFNLHHPEL
jgi:hypothetical protein